MDVQGTQVGLAIVTRNPRADGGSEVQAERRYRFRLGERVVQATSTTNATLDAQDRVLTLTREGDFGRVAIGRAPAGLYWLEEARAPLLAALRGEPIALQIVAPAGGDALAATLLRVDADTVGWSTRDAQGEFDVDSAGRIVGARQGPVSLRVVDGSDWEAPDIARVLGLPVAPIPHARARPRVDLLVNGVRTRNEVPLRVEIPPLPVAATEPEALAALGDAPGLGVGDPALKRRAAQLAGKATTRLDAVDALAAGLFRTLDHTPTPGLPSALGALSSGVGDCNEQAALFVGLARTLGIPSRRVAGLLYLDEPNPGFYPHEWAEVWYGPDVGWVPADPSFAQGVADAARWPLAREADAPLWTVLAALPGLRLEVASDR